MYDETSLYVSKRRTVLKSTATRGARGSAFNTGRHSVALLASTAFRIPVSRLPLN